MSNIENFHVNKTPQNIYTPDSKNFEKNEDNEMKSKFDKSTSKLI